MPELESGQVLIRVIAAPINPSDYGKWFKPLAVGESN